MGVKKLIVDFFKDEEGLTVVEYVIGAALLVAGLTGIFNVMSSGLNTSLSTTVGKIGS
jgi:pilus assembly protein Flp/PilA